MVMRTSIWFFWIKYHYTQFEEIDRKDNAFLLTYLSPCPSHSVTPVNVIENNDGPVSYTHLTLPTIYSV